MARFTDYRTFKTAIGGKLLEVEIGKVCELANGQVWVSYGDTVVNVTACASKEPRPDADFFPLSCDFEEKMYAAGKIPGGFIKREGRPSEKAILTSRLMDRPLRPLFPKGFYNDVQVVATCMSMDHDCPVRDRGHDRFLRRPGDLRHSRGMVRRVPSESAEWTASSSSTRPWSRERSPPCT